MKEKTSTYQTALKILLLLTVEKSIFFQIKIEVGSGKFFHHEICNFFD